MGSEHTTTSDARKEYGDIIDREHYVDPNHPQMSRLNRAAQFSPFAALTGYDDLIDEAARQTDEWAEPDESAKEEIGRRLNDLLHAKQPAVAEITYFVPDAKKQGGAYHTVSGVIRKYDEHKREIYLDSGDVIGLDTVTELTEYSSRFYGQA